MEQGRQHFPPSVLLSSVMQPAEKILVGWLALHRMMHDDDVQDESINEHFFGISCTTEWKETVCGREKSS